MPSCSSSHEGSVGQRLSRIVEQVDLAAVDLQVHDVAGFSDENGQLIPRPDGHPYLRMTHTLAPGMVVTIEPGLYFIPTLLSKLKATPQAKAVNWPQVEKLLPYGGVRIEDEVHCTDAAPENLTRDAFAELG